MKNLLQKFFFKLKRNLQMKLVWRFRRHVFFQGVEKYLALLNASIWMFLLGMLIWAFDKVIPFIRYFTDPGIATMVSGIVGAVIGGTFAYIVAVDVHKRELKAAGVLKRRDEIYRPLYEELLNMKRAFSEDTIFMDSSEVVFGTTFSLENLPFSKPKAWLLHSHEVKLSQNPVDLAEAMNKLIALINAGEIAESKVLHDKEFRKLLKIQKSLMRKYSSNPQEDVRLFLKLEEVNSQIEESISYRNFKKSMDEFFLKLDEVVNYLEELIKYVNKRFDQEATWY